MTKIVNALSACALTVFANTAADAAPKKTQTTLPSPAICNIARTEQETKSKKEQSEFTIGYSQPTGVFGLNPLNPMK